MCHLTLTVTIRRGDTGVCMGVRHLRISTADAETKGSWWVTAAASARRSPSARDENIRLPLKPVTTRTPSTTAPSRESSPRFSDKGKHGRVALVRLCDGQQARADGTYPENDVETEDEVLDAAAHFMSLEMLSRNHEDGFSSRPSPLAFWWREKGITSTALGCLTALLICYVVRGSTNAVTVVSATDPQHHAVRR